MFFFSAFTLNSEIPWPEESTVLANSFPRRS
jgi:hypothetical protein